MVQARDTFLGARDAFACGSAARGCHAVPRIGAGPSLVQCPRPCLSSARAVPQGAEAGRERLADLTLAPKLADGLRPARDWCGRAYPMVWLGSNAPASWVLRTCAQWQQVAAQLPTYLDSEMVWPATGRADGERRRNDT